jgi:hypothetical protein
MTNESKQPTELELHRADHIAILKEGFSSPGELLSAYKRLKEKSESYNITYHHMQSFEDKVEMIEFIHNGVRQTMYCDPKPSRFWNQHDRDLNKQVKLPIGYRAVPESLPKGYSNLLSEYIIHWLSSSSRGTGYNFHNYIHGVRGLQIPDWLESIVPDNGDQVLTKDILSCLYRALIEEIKGNMPDSEYKLKQHGFSTLEEVLESHSKLRTIILSLEGAIKSEQNRK